DRRRHRRGGRRQNAWPPRRIPERGHRTLLPGLDDQGREDRWISRVQEAGGGPRSRGAVGARRSRRVLKTKTAFHVSGVSRFSQNFAVFFALTWSAVRGAEW